MSEAQGMAAGRDVERGRDHTGRHPARPASSTIRELLDEATRRLEGSGSRSPRLDAELLLGEILAQTRTQLLTWHDRAVDDADRARFEQLLERRVAREPVAYILGRRGFYDLTLEVTRDVLIPRAETEILVDEALAFLRGRRRPRVLDVGTGSGAIALAVAKHVPDATVMATDVSTAALEVARRNGLANGLGVDWRAGDVYEAVAGEPPFDLILSNPPYVSPQEYSSLEPNVRDYEPHCALFADESGLSVLRRLCEQAKSRLVYGGALGVEIGTSQAAAVSALMQRHGFERVRVVADLAAHDRVVWGQ